MMNELSCMWQRNFLVASSNNFVNKMDCGVSLRLLFIWLCYFVTYSFIWNIGDTLPKGYPLKIYEGAMFATNQGPLLLEKGPSYIELKAQLTSYSKTNATNYFVLLFYNIEEKHMYEDITDVCSLDQSSIKSLPYVHDASLVAVKTTYNKCTVIPEDPRLNLNSHYCIESAQVNHHYEVHSAGIQQLLIVHCGIYDGNLQRRLSQEHIQLAHAETTQSQSEFPSSSMSTCRSKSSLRKFNSVFQRLFPSTNLANTISTTSIPTTTAKPHSIELQGTPPSRDYVTSEGWIEGTITFHNPYGFIPGQLFGLLPFELVRMIVCLFAFLLFLIVYVQYLQSVMTLHTVLLSFLLLTAIESLFWYATYQWLNNTGIPYCCPYPPLVIASLVLQILRQTCTRALLLLICLGYGIVRPKLLLTEWILIATTILLYLFATIFAEVYQILLENSTNSVWADALRTYEPYSELPAMIMDMLLIAWIYLAIFSTIRILKEFRQTSKLQLYQRLVYGITVLVSGFTVITVLYWLDEEGVLVWPWAWEWVQEALWQLLNFSIILLIAFIWRPHEHSQRLAYASQLPTEDPDEEEEEEIAFTRTASRYDRIIERLSAPFRSAAATLKNMKNRAATATSSTGRSGSNHSNNNNNRRGGGKNRSSHGLLSSDDDDDDDDQGLEDISEFEMVGYDRYHRGRHGNKQQSNSSTAFFDTKQHGRRRVAQEEVDEDEENYLDLPDVYEDARYGTNGNGNGKGKNREELDEFGMKD